jgi:hypothetical protein
MICLKEEVQKKLNIYTKNNNQSYTKCLIRGLEIPINGRPEELVRQIFVHFFITESALFPNKINIRIEVNNHDIEIHKKNDSDFRPYKPPLIIVELKREDVNLKSHYNQIQRYLENARCNIGILYNFHEIVLFNRKDDLFEISKINSLSDVELIVLESENIIDKDILEFEKAQNGIFDSFSYLISKYGKRQINTVTFRLKRQQREIEGSFFRIQGNKVYHDIYGKNSKKQENFDIEDFERLISIVY